MRKLKRMIALVTVAMFLLSLAAPVASADDQVDSFNRLNALGVVVGDQNGDPMYDKNYTRAEAAAVMVQLTGMGAAINAAKGATKFADVPASHWASGVINLAVGSGIIKGYPNGTYQPEKAVTYAEMCAMLVQALGYGPKLQGTWPANVIGKAAELGLLDDITVENYNAPAVRSQVFIAADNALEVEILQENKDGYETVTGETLMSEKLNVTEVEDKVVTGVTSAFNGLDADQVELAGVTKDIKTKGNFLGFYGLNVNYYVKDNKVISLKADEDEVFTDKIKSVTAADLAANRITFWGKGVKDTVTTIAVSADYATGLEADLAAGQFVTVVMDGSKVAKIIIAPAFDGFGVVEAVDGDRVEFKDEPSANDIDLDGVDMDKVQIYKNGQVAALSDIKAGDVVSYAEGGTDEWLIMATNGVVEGKLEAISKTGNAYKMTIGGKTVFANLTLAYSTDAGDEYLPADLDDMNDDIVGQNVKAYLDPNGEAQLVVAGSASDSADSNKVVVRNITAKDDVSGNTNDVTMYIKVTKMDGTDVTYEIDNDDYTVADPGAAYSTLDTNDEDGTDDVDVAPFYLAKITLDSAGKVTKVEALDVEAMRAADGINTDNKLIYNDADSSFLVTDDSAFIQVDEYDDAVAKNAINKSKKVTWASIDDNETDVEGMDVVFYADGKEIVLALLMGEETDDLSSDEQYGVVVGGQYGIGGGDYAVKLMVNGETKQYTLVDSFIYANAPVVFTVNSDGEVDEINTVAKNVDGFFNFTAQVTVKKVTTVGDKLVITDSNDDEYMVKKDAVKYFNTTSGTIATDSGIGAGDVVVLYDFLDKDGDVAADTDGDSAIDDIYDYVVTVD